MRDNTRICAGRRPRGILKEYFLGLKRVGSIPNIPATCVSSSPNIVRRTSRLKQHHDAAPVNNECWLVPENKVGSGSGQKVVCGVTPIYEQATCIHAAYLAIQSRSFSNIGEYNSGYSYSRTGSNMTNDNSTESYGPHDSRWFTFLENGVKGPDVL